MNESSATPSALGARLLLAATPLVPFVVVVPGGKWLLPFLAPLTLYVWFSRRVRLGDHFGAWKIGMAWAGLLSLGVILLVYLLPAAAAAGILNGEPYREEMFGWIRTGIAPENTPSIFIPQHLLHLGLFVVLAYVSAGYLGLVLGTALTAYMSYFVASYAVAADRLLLGPVVAWVPWSVLRVAAFVLIGAVVARPLLVRRAWPFERRDGLLLGLAASGIVGDVVVKAAIAPTYGVFLRHFAGW
jgi:hypothetical protein